jgi:cation diffusion facilitator family transporter
MHTEYRKAKFATWVGIGGNILLALIKMIFGVLGNSTALLADGVHSLSDIGSSLVVLYGLNIASRPKDKDHPYGHGKAESLAARSVAGLLIILAGLIAYQALRRLFNIELLQPPARITLGVAFFSYLIKEWMFRYKFKLAKKLVSSSLLADAWHHRSDAWSSVVVLLGIGGAIIAGPRWRLLDPLAAIVVALIIGVIGINIFRKTTGELMDESASERLIKRLRNLTENTPGVLGVEKIYARKSGLDFLVDIHLEVDKNLSVENAHRIATNVKNKINQKIPQVSSVLVHIEPFYPDDH